MTHIGGVGAGIGGRPERPVHLRRVGTVRGVAGSEGGSKEELQGRLTVHDYGRTWCGGGMLFLTVMAVTAGSRMGGGRTPPSVMHHHPHPEAYSQLSCTRPHHMRDSPLPTSRL